MMDFMRPEIETGISPPAAIPALAASVFMKGRYILAFTNIASFNFFLH